MNHPIVGSRAAMSSGMSHGVGYPVASDPTYEKAYDAVRSQSEDWAVVYSRDYEAILFRAWRVSQFSFAYQTGAMGAPAFAQYTTDS